MKRFVPALCALALLISLAACNQQQAPTQTIGVVDETVAFQKNSATTEAMAYLQKKGEALQAEAQQAYEAVQKEESEENVAAYKQAMGKLQQTMGAEQKRIFGMLNDEFVKVLDDYRQEKGLDIILPKQSTLSFGDAIDVTDEVVERMNTIKIDFNAKGDISENAKPEESEAAEQ